MTNPNSPDNLFMASRDFARTAYAEAEALPHAVTPPVYLLQYVHRVALNADDDHIPSAAYTHALLSRMPRQRDAARTYLEEFSATLQATAIMAEDVSRLADALQTFEWPYPASQKDVLDTSLISIKGVSLLFNVTDRVLKTRFKNVSLEERPIKSSDMLGARPNLFIARQALAELVTWKQPSLQY